MGRAASTRLRVFGFWVLTFFIAGYFTVHGLGLGNERGVLTIDKLNHDIVDARARLADLVTERAWLEHKVKLVSRDQIDADILGELARKEGGLYAPDEIVIEFN
ncbi:septum formation initiator family protein [Alphaproteobacteria bacterium LSUCC0684]